MVVLFISRDLPFALKRFFGAKGLENVVSSSKLRDTSFSYNYGVRIKDGGLSELMSRTVVVIDEKGLVSYTEQVPEIADEPNYANVVELLK